MPQSTKEGRKRYARAYYRKHRALLLERAKRRAKHPSYRKKRNAWSRERYQKDPVKERDRNLRAWYGITRQDYEKMLTKQKCLCKICLEKMVSPQVDHCHVTKKVRGLLCGPCNRMLGMAKDSAERLRRAADYLTGLP